MKNHFRKTLAVKTNSLPHALSRMFCDDVQEPQHAGCVILSWFGTGTGQVDSVSVQLLAQALPPVPRPFHG